MAPPAIEAESFVSVHKVNEHVSTVSEVDSLFARVLVTQMDPPLRL